MGTLLKTIKIKPDETIKFVAMEWREENWEFDFPSMLLEPVVQWFESGRHCDGVIEDAVIDACVEEKLKDEEFPEFRGNLQYLRRVAREVQKGKKFPNKGYEVRIETVRFFLNDENELESETTSVEEFG